MEFLKSATTWGGVKYSKTPTQSLASISAKISTYGIFMEFASSTMNANNSRENIFKEPFNGGCTRLDLPVENKQIKFSSFQSTLNYISSFDSDKISYKKNFSSLISKANNVPTLIYIDCDMGHGLEHNPDKDAPFSSNFGLMSVTPTLAAVNNFMASRFTFFARAKYIGLWDSLLGPSKFIDCEDYRHGCTKYADHCDTTNASCSDNFVGE